MKIIFVKEQTITLSQNHHEAWTSYVYDENNTSKSGFADIRSILQTNAASWLLDLKKSHLLLSKELSARSPWWWLTPFSRLDVRPWGSQAQFKPLFFARAIIEWQRQNPHIQQLYILHAPSSLAQLMKDFDSKIHVDGFLVFKGQCDDLLKWAQEKIIFKLKWMREIALLILKKKNIVGPIKGVTKLIISERFAPQMSNRQTHQYYYGDMLDHCDKAKVAFKVLDEFSVNNVMFVVGQSLAWDMWMLGQSWEKRACVIGGVDATSFWSRFLLTQYSKNLILKELVVYKTLSCYLENSNIDTIVYPYEEKGYERALLMVCRKTKIKTIGYTPHPQHALALSMQDDATTGHLKPSQYAVCGNKYVSFFEDWGKKPQGSVHVWGSPKSTAHNYHQKILGPHVTMLLLLSHPDELRIFATWLQAVPELQINKTYMIRGYKSVPDAYFTRQLDALIQNFTCVVMDTGDFATDMNACDLALFNATSAGLMAINLGKIAIHLCLDDIFPINPCFNNVDFVLSCASAKAFNERLKELKSKDIQALASMWQQQHEHVQQIFGSVDKAMIQKDLGC